MTAAHRHRAALGYQRRSAGPGASRRLAPMPTRFVLATLALGQGFLAACNALLGNQLDSFEPAPPAQEGGRGAEEVAEDGRDAGVEGGALRSYREEVLADNPAGYWRLGEPTGALAATDESGNSRSGTFESCALGATGAIQGDSNTA